MASSSTALDRTSAQMRFLDEDPKAREVRFLTDRIVEDLGANFLQHFRVLLAGLLGLSPTSTGLKQSKVQMVQSKRIQK